MFRNAWDNFLIALIIWHVCVVPTVVSERFRPKVYAAPSSPPAIVKIQERHKERT